MVHPVSRRPSDNFNIFDSKFHLSKITANSHRTKTIDLSCSYVLTEFAIINDFTIIRMYARECELLYYDLVN